MTVDDDDDDDGSGSTTNAAHSRMRRLIHVLLQQRLSLSQLIRKQSLN